MAKTNYQFTKVALPAQLEREIRDSVIVTALDSIVLNGTEDLNVWFKDALSGGDETLLGELVTAHTPVPIPDVPQPVVTVMELDNKALCLASVESDQWADDKCSLDIVIPGDVGGVGRFIKDGYAFTDAYVWGLRVIDVELIDTSFAYAGSLYPATPTEAGIPEVEGMSWEDIMPGGVVLGGYCDTGVAEANRGWRMWCEEGGQGGMEVNSLAGYGELLSGCTLRVVVQRPSGNTTVTKCAINLEWGMPK
jgi:hypothetical protein